MSRAIEQGTEFAAIPWAEAMAELAEALRARGRAVPPGCTVTLERVPEAERDAQGLPLYRAKVVQHGC